MFIETRKIKQSIPIDDDLIKVEYEDGTMPDIYHKEIFEIVKSEEPNPDLTKIQNDRCEPIVQKILELFLKYSIRYNDISYISAKLNESIIMGKKRMEVKVLGYDVPMNVDPLTFTDKITFKHVHDILMNKQEEKK